MAQEKRKRGRPSIYSEKLAAEICSRVAEGHSLLSICKSSDMPAVRTVFYWVQDKPEFKVQLDLAMDCRTDAMIEEILVIPDIEEDVNRARLKVDTRKWIAARMKPKKYGERTIHEGGDAPLKVATITAEMTPEEAGRLYKELVGG